MVAQLIEVLRQGIWASLTGGYFYQPQNNSFCNTLQLYTWIVLVALPFSLYLYGSSVEAWTAYGVSITAIFASVKFLNWQLHNLFDKKEIIEEVPGVKESVEEGDDLELKTFATASETQLAVGENEDSSPSEPTMDTSNLQNFVEATVHQKSSGDDFQEVSKEETKEGSGTVELDELQTKDESPSAHEKSPSIKEEHERPSMKSGNVISSLKSVKSFEYSISSVSSFLPSTERRFSNVSNLARSIAHSSSAGSAGFQGLHAAGSLELGYVLEESPVRRPKSKKQSVRRTQSAVVTSPGIGTYEPPPSHIVSLDPIGRSDFLRPLDARRQPSANIKPISENDDSAPLNSEKGKSEKEEEREEETFESERKSVERTRKSPSTSSKSLDKPLQVTFASEFTVVPINIDSEETSVCDTNTSPSVDLVKDCDNQQSSENMCDSEQERHSHGKEKQDTSSEDVDVEPSSSELPVNSDREAKRWSVSSFVGLSRLFKQGESLEDVSFSYQAIPTVAENSSYASLSLSDESEYEVDPKSPLLTNPQPEPPPALPTDGLGSDACRSELGRLLIDILSRDTIEGCEKELEKLRETLSKTQANEARNHSEESDSFPSAGPSSALDPNWTLCPWSPTRAGLRPAPPPPNLESSSHISRTPTPPPLHPRSHRLRNRPMEDYINLLGRRQSDDSPSEMPIRPHLPWNVYSIESRVGTEPLTQIGPLPLPPLGRPWIAHNQGDSSSISQTFTTVRSDRPFPSPGGSSVSLGNSGTLVIDSPNVRFVRNRLRHYTTRSARREHLQPNSDGILPSASPDYFHPLTLHAMLNTLPTAMSPQDERERVEEPVVPKPKRYYRFSICKKSVKIRYDRLQLLALLDRNWGILETVLSVALALLVAVLGAVLLSRDLCRDFCAFLLCVVIGGCQYSLFKSVQPDAASPTHGFNRLVAFSRPTFFCVFSCIVILIDMCLEVRGELSPFFVYGFDITSINLWTNIRDLTMLIILSFPLIFTLGMLPQISTFLMYILEQIDINIFGGSAVTGLLSSFYAILRSVFLVTFLYGFAYIGLIQPEKTQHVLFSIFCALLASSCYHFSRYSSDPSVLISMASKKSDGSDENDFRDPLPAKLRITVLKRLKSDLIMCLLIGVLVFAVHVSTVFTVLQRILTDILWSVAVAVGFVLHYVIPQARKKLPWSCFAHPFLKPNEYERFEVSEMAKLMWFEKLYVWVGFFEKNILYIVLYLCALTRDSNPIVEKYGIYFGTLIVVICAIKCVRSTLNNPSHNYIVVLFTIAMFNYDLSGRSETFLVDYCVLLSVYQKVREMLLKIQFVTTYVAPWQISWGSAFHAFAQPISIPHSAMLFVQAAFSSLFSAPLSPFLGSAIFLTSYARPIKFWEKDYNTKRIDSSNTKLVSQLERNLGSDDNNLNSIFYEQLTRSLQHTLAGDLILGRWGTVGQGDCFILTSDNMNCLVHIIEIANGLVTFQLRGMEFRGTYCQQREIEAITEDVEDDQGCCCCEPGHLPHMLSGNAAFSQRWLAWQVTATKYVVEGYTVSDNNAASVLQVYDLRKLLITFYVKAVIYFAMTSQKLTDWLESPAIIEGIAPLSSKLYVDVDPTFNKHFDEDFDYQSRGISRNSFSRVHLDWIRYCGQRREKKMEIRRDSLVVSFCMALSLLARRCLCSASPKALSSVDFFLHCLHSLFKGDFRVTCPRDEWVFTDMDLLKKVIAPAVKMSVKLHQDHFMSPDEYDDPQCLYEAIESHQKNWFISHEGDPAWRAAVLSGVPSLLALRHVVDETSAEYKIVMLNKRWLSFRVIKLNRECVRGFWAGQQQELVFLRNRHAERGSIQNAKQVLRNIINSSCDQPIGYPIFVSPLTTSYADTHPQLSAILGGPIEFGAIRRVVRNFWNRLRRRCREGCVSGGSAGRCEENISLSTLQFVSVQQGRLTSEYYSSVPILGAPATVQRGSRGSLGTQRGSVGSTLSTTRKPSGSTLVSLAGLLAERDAGCLELNRHDPGSSRDYFNAFYRAPAEPDIEESGPMRHDQTERPKNFHIRSKQLSIGEDTEEGKAGETSKSSARTARNSFVGKAVIRNADSVYDSMNLGRRIDPVWPCQEWKDKGGRNAWKYWVPDQGMEGEVVHMWVPYHHVPEYRSPVFRKILLLRIDQWYVPIAESGVEYLGNYRAVIDPELQIFRPIRKNLPLGCTVNFEFVNPHQAPVKPPRSSTSKLEYPVAGASSDVRLEDDAV